MTSSEVQIIVLKLPNKNFNGLIGCCQVLSVFIIFLLITVMLFDNILDDYCYKLELHTCFNMLFVIFFILSLIKFK